MSSNKDVKVQAAMIIEVLGRPPEHLVETLNDFAQKISGENGVKILNKKITEPQLVKDQKDLYTAFIDIEVETETIMHLAGLMFKYMPAHIEVISPENIILKNNFCGEMLSEIVRRLHKYDELVRIIDSQNVMLKNQLKLLQENSAEVKEDKAKPKKEKKR